MLTRMNEEVVLHLKIMLALREVFSTARGKNTLSFNNGNIEGDATAARQYATNTVTFEGAGNQITGNVSALGGKNYITLKGLVAAKSQEHFKLIKTG